jgi:hypothetical protein
MVAVQTQLRMFTPAMRRYWTAPEAIANRRENENAIVIDDRYFTVDASEILTEEHAVLGRDRNLSSQASLTTLSFSGGRQSSWILEAVLRGEIEKPETFLVVTADPGAEKQETYARVKSYQERCSQAGIDFVIASGPNIIQDMKDLKRGDKGRLDNPPLFTRHEAHRLDSPPQQPQGEVFSAYLDAVNQPERYRATNEVMRNGGQLKQCCTSHYKIAPIRRAIRNHLRTVVRESLKPGVVDTWIGFASHEIERAVKIQKDVAWQNLRFPMIEMGITADRVYADWKRWNLPEPVPSMCNCCPFHGTRSLKDMYENRSADWIQATEYDELARNLDRAGVKSQAFCSSLLTPLSLLPILGFESGDAVRDDNLMCDSGMCFM